MSSVHLTRDVLCPHSLVSALYFHVYCYKFGRSAIRRNTQGNSGVNFDPRLFQLRPLKYICG